VLLLIIAVLTISLKGAKKKSDGHVISGISRMLEKAMDQKEREVDLRIKCVELCVNESRSIENVIRDSKVIYDFISGKNLEKKSDEEKHSGEHS
jgi:hypothetical protein